MDDHLEETETHRADRTRIYGPLRTQRPAPLIPTPEMIPLSECCAWCQDRHQSKARGQ